jgi:hypothetical protein
LQVPALLVAHVKLYRGHELLQSIAARQKAVEVAARKRPDAQPETLLRAVHVCAEHRGTVKTRHRNTHTQMRALRQTHPFGDEFEHAHRHAEILFEQLLKSLGIARLRYEPAREKTLVPVG